MPSMGSRRMRKYIIIVCFIFSVTLFVLVQILPSNDHTDYVSDDTHILPYWLFEEVDYGGKLVDSNGTDEHDKDHVNSTLLDIKHPIILWWTGFTGERGRVKQCGQNKCFFTVDRHFQNHPKTQVFVFYGTDFKAEDLPLPRKQHHEWALLHEESPKNNYILCHSHCLRLFNHTSTFKRESDYPITTQYLDSLSALTDLKYMVPTKNKSQDGLASAVYVHSDCDPPSDRDAYVTELMKYIKIDAYGQCLHNKELPERLQDPLTMDDEAFFRILAQYKFNLAFENAICNDYITEKLWRPLSLGSVPVYRGSPKIRDWLPDNQSAILVDEFETPEKLAAYLNKLANDDKEYDNYLQFKRTGIISNQHLIESMKHRKWGINDPEQTNFISGFECFICNRIHANAKSAKKRTFVASEKHYDCPMPVPFKATTGFSNNNKWYVDAWREGAHEAKALYDLVMSGRRFTQSEFINAVWQSRH